MESVKSKPQHKLSVMGPEGHAEIVWDVHDFDSVSNAKKMFDDLLSKKWQAFAVEREDDKIHSAKKGGKITKFDPSAGEIVMVPPVSGG